MQSIMFAVATSGGPVHDLGAVARLSDELDEARADNELLEKMLGRALVAVKARECLIDDLNAENEELRDQVEMLLVKNEALADAIIAGVEADDPDDEEDEAGDDRLDDDDERRAMRDVIDAIPRDIAMRADNGEDIGNDELRQMSERFNEILGGKSRQDEE